MTEGQTLELSGALTATTVGAQWKQRLATARSAATISLAGVTELDSAGVAMVRCLQRAARRDGGQCATLEDLPERFEQICLAHRIDAEGN